MTWGVMHTHTHYTQGHKKCPTNNFLSFHLLETMFWFSSLLRIDLTFCTNRAVMTLQQSEAIFSGTMKNYTGETIKGNLNQDLIG